MDLTRRRFIPLLGALVVGGFSTTAAAKTHGQHGAAGAPTPEQIWADLMEGNRRFIAGKPKPRNLVQARAALANGQHPRVIVLGCADSRVVPTIVFDKGPGDLFVVRTAGNVADPIGLGSIEYAAEHLHSSVLVILGHEKCGAVTAALSGEPMPTPNLEAIVAKIMPAVEKVKGRGEADKEKLLALTIEANVQQSAQDVVANSPIVAQEVAAGKLTVIKAVYRLKTGAITRLA